MNQTEKTPRFARMLGEGLNESLLKVARVEHCLKDEWCHGSVVSTNAVCGLLEHGYTHQFMLPVPTRLFGFFSAVHDAYCCCNKLCVLCFDTTVLNVPSVKWCVFLVVRFFSCHSD